MTDKETADIEAGATRPTNFIRQIIETIWSRATTCRATGAVIRLPIPNNYKRVSPIGRVFARVFRPNPTAICISVTPRAFA